MPCRLVFFSVIIFFTGYGIHAQTAANYSFQNISHEEGLLHNNVIAVTQDAKGFIWVVTKNGLQRYDGARFLNFPDMLSNPADARAVGVTAYADNTNNCLWVLKIDKIEKFEPAANRFSLYDYHSLYNNPSFPHEQYTDENNSPWLLGSNASYSYDSSTQKYTLAQPDINPLAANTSNFFVRDSAAGLTWMSGGAAGLALFHKASKKIYTAAYNPLHMPMLEAFGRALAAKAYPVRHLMKDSRGNYWLTLWTNVFFCYHPATGKMIRYALPDIIKKSKGINANNGEKIINSLYEDNHGTIWLLTENAGLLRYNVAADTFEPVVIDELNTAGTRYSYAVNCIFQDREENLWIGTDRGITIFNPYRKFYRAIHHEENNAASLPKSEVTGFLQAASGDIVAGTWGGGITVYDSNWQYKKNLVFKGPADYNLIWSFAQSDDGNIWTGCQHGYIHQYNLSLNTAVSLHPPETEGATIRCMAKDAAGNIWLGLHNGKIVKWDKRTNKFVAYRGATAEVRFAPVLYIYFDIKDNCWVATETGFKKFDTERMVYAQTWLPDTANPHAISGKTIGGIEQYNDSVLLVGTVYGGLNFFNMKTNVFSHLSTADGLPSNTICAIKKDTAGNVWFTTEYSLYKFRPPETKFTRFNTAVSDITSSFDALYFRQLNAGRWMTATETELFCFTPGKPAFPAGNLAKVEIAGFRVFDTPLFIDSLLAKQQPVQLNYRQNFITVEFALLHFSSIQQTKYYYRMSGVNSNWVNADTRQSASYTNLAPGTYTFSVKADDESNLSPPASFVIIIAPPFWKTNWFLSLVAAAIICMLYGFVRWRIKSIRAVEEEKLKVQQLNAEQYRNQLELEQIVNYFSTSLINKNSVDDALWDVARNLIGRLGFEDCMIYLWNADKTKMIQRAGYGPKGSIEEIQKQVFDVAPGQGVVGHVMQTKEPLLIPDTSRDPRYRADEMVRLSEITVPVIYDNELVGIIDSEHHARNFFTQQHVQVLSTIATLVATKVNAIVSEHSLQLAKMEMMSINEKLAAAKLEALRSQMNPHFIFNCINSIDNLIQSNDKERATLYLAKFAKLIRSVLETSKTNTVPCWKDMETLRVYIELEALRLDNKFSYHIDISPEILDGDYKVPPLVVQPFVENAIHHGLLNKIEPNRKLLIMVWANGNYVHYLVEDNGVGRAKAAAYRQLNKAEHESMGMQLSIERINLFNQQPGTAVTITDLFDNKNEPVGTRVEVALINQ